MKNLFNSILIGFPIKLILSSFFIELDFVPQAYDTLLTSGLFLVWVFAILEYDDMKFKNPFKRLNVISFPVVISILVTFIY